MYVCEWEIDRESKGASYQAGFLFDLAKKQAV